LDFGITNTFVQWTRSLASGLIAKQAISTTPKEKRKRPRLVNAWGDGSDEAILVWLRHYLSQELEPDDANRIAAQKSI
jgi:hypothetical protein